MRLALLVAVAFLAVVTVVPAPAAAEWDPFAPPSGCGGFHFHKGNVLEGDPPVYPHYHHCF